MASKDALNAAYEDVRSDSSDTVWYVLVFEFSKLAQNQTGLDRSSILKFLESGFSVRKIKFDSLKLN